MLFFYATCYNTHFCIEKLLKTWLLECCSEHNLDVNCPIFGIFGEKKLPKIKLFCIFLEFNNLLFFAYFNITSILINELFQNKPYLTYLNRMNEHANSMHNFFTICFSDMRTVDRVTHILIETAVRKSIGRFY